MMIVRFNAYVQINNSFWIRKGDFFEEVNGKSILIEGFKDFDLFIHKVEKGKISFWVVSEAISGTRLTGLNKSLKKVMIDAEKKLRLFKASRAQYKISEKVANKFISPRYRFVANPNNVIYVATTKDNNSKSVFPRVYGVLIHEE